jgi:hypothetical protein
MEMKGLGISGGSDGKMALAIFLPGLSSVALMDYHSRPSFHLFHTSRENKSSEM